MIKYFLSDMKQSIIWDTGSRSCSISERTPDKNHDSASNSDCVSKVRRE